MLLLVILGTATATLGASTALPGAAPEAATDAAVSMDRTAILAPADVARYRQIFDLQEAAKWRAADRLIKQLDDKVLMGHVLFQRYMHPTGYRSRYTELAPWLTTYGDLPGAYRIYRLALRRQPPGTRSPLRPLPAKRQPSAEPLQVAAQASVQLAALPVAAAKPRISATKRREIATLRSRINRYLRRGNPDRAEKRLWASQRPGILDDARFDRQLARIAEAYFYTGDDSKALALAALAARSRADVSLADWTAGLAAWRLGEWDVAGYHFEALAREGTASKWKISAAALWAARAYLVAQKPGKVNELLAIAAEQSRTFYGLIAARQLGRTVAYAWDQPPLEDGDYDKLNQLDGALRAMALVQVGKTHWADQDLRLVARRAGPGSYPALLGLAARLGLPSTQLVLSDLIPAQAKPVLDTVLYPLPDWEPEGGFYLDKAMLFAVIRQESRFNNRAKSSAGARGLMQLMPATASFITRDRSLRNGNKTKLYAPGFNMALGQRYLKYLTDLDHVGSNLFLVVSAYNGGPGNLRRWLKTTGHGDDWLLFIETIPSAETRDFIERVLANLWIYRARLGQPAPTLEAVAAGDWPGYTALDNKVFETADTKISQAKPWPESTTASPSSVSISP